MSTKSEMQISMDSSLTIQNAKNLKSKLTEAFESSQDIIITCPPITKIDLSVLQLLLAAQTKAASLEKKISFHFELADPLRSIIDRSGFSTLFPLIKKGLNN